MSNTKKLVCEVQNHFDYKVNRAIIAGEILAKINDSSRVISTKEDFIQAYQAYNDSKHKQLVKDLQVSIRKAIANVESSQLFDATNIYGQLNTEDLLKVHNELYNQ